VAVVPEAVVPEPLAPEAVVSEALVPEAAVPEAAVPEAAVPEALVPELLVFTVGVVGVWADASGAVRQIATSGIARVRTSRSMRLRVAELNVRTPRIRDVREGLSGLCGTPSPGIVSCLSTPVSSQKDTAAFYTCVEFG
jgi:hypothetical protein